MKNIMYKIIEVRTRELLVLIKEAKQINLIERELALLAVDIILALKKEGMVKFGCHCFRKIDFAITGTLRKRLSEEIRDLLNEMIILDEVGKKYGPDLNFMINLAKKILDKQGNKFISEARELIKITVS